MSFRITGHSAEPFRHLYRVCDQDLARHGVKRCTADRMPGFPDRIEMRDASPGGTLLLLNHVCQPASLSAALPSLAVQFSGQCVFDA